MIFHTAADEVYYNKFYQIYSNSIKKFYPNDELSLFFLGNKLLKNNDIKYLNQKHISFEEIQNIYSTNEKDTKGYYALSRWYSMPITDNHVVVSDVDIIALKNIPDKFIDTIFLTNQVINITRVKSNGSEGGMAMMIIRKDIVENINNTALSILKEKNLRWDLDVQVRSYIYNTFSVKEIPEMHVYGKKSNYITHDNTNRSFAIFKGRINAKYNSLSKAESSFKT